MIGYPDGTSQHLKVDDFGQISSVTNQVGAKTSYAYDTTGRLTKITYPGGWNPKTFMYAYVSSAERGLDAGHWRRTASQGSARHVTYYDALLHPVLTDAYIADESSSHITNLTAYDWRGLTTFTSWPVADSPSLSAITAGTTTSYDALGRITQVSQPSEVGTLTTVTTYLSGGRKKITDAAGHATTTSYQVFDTPSYEAVIKVQAPEGIVQTLTRDLYGNPTAITQSGPDGQGGTTSITKHLYYNAQHRLCRSEEPETGNTLMGYDNAGNLLWRTEGQTVSGGGCGSTPAASGRTNRTYDAMNRVTAVSHPDGQGDSATTYTALGQVARTQAMAANGSAQWDYTYDTLGHLTDEALNVDGYSWPIHYTYDLNGALSRITYPSDEQVNYAPDALGRPTQAGPYATGVGYFPDGALSQFTYMGSEADYLADRFDPAYRPLLKNLTVGNGNTGTLVYSEDFTYDENANITRTTDLTLSGERSKTLTYDALNRLTQAKAPALWGTTVYGYDALNNLRRLTSGGLVRTYHYDAANRLTSIQDGTTVLDIFAYGPSGDVTQKDNQSRVFSAAHRLLQIPGKASYVYDAAGRRVKSTDADGHATYAVYNRDGHLMVQWNKATETTTNYIYLGKKLIAEVATSPLSPASAPSLSAPATDSDGNYTVSWNSVGNAASYTLQEQVGNNWSTLYAGGGTSHPITGKGNGSYPYRVKACNSAGCSSWSTIRTVTVTHSPGSAPDLSVPASSHTGSYTVSWNSIGTATSYTLQERNGTGAWAEVYSGSGLGASVSGKANGSYGYRVQACNTGGCGNWSAIQDVTVLLPPLVPSSLTAPAANSTGSYTINWGAASTATNYTLQERTNAGSWSTAYSGSDRSKTESGKANGSYGYRVQACNTGGCSSWSNAKTVVVTHPPGSAPGLSVPATNSDGSYTVGWDAVSTTTSYTLQEREGSGSWAEAYNGKSRSKAISGMADGTYSYRVRACTVGGCGPWSSTKTVTVARPPTSAPSLNVPSSNDSGSYTVKWGSVSRTTSYTLQERKNSGSWSSIYNSSDRSKNRSGLADGTYGYRVRACNAGGCGPWSTTHTVSVVTIPPVPQHVGPDYDGNNKIIHRYLIWDAVSMATRYEVKVGSSSTIVYSGTDTRYMVDSFRVLDIPPEIMGYVRACNTHGCSAWASATVH